MRILNGTVFGADGRFAPGDVCTDGVLFSEHSGDETELDATGKYVIPGLIDIHVHGCHNSDFCDATPDSISDFLQYEASVGVTAICPTTMTVPAEKLLKVAEATGAYFRDLQADPQSIQHRKEASFLGINMEGPFIAPEKKGAQELTDILLPDVSLVRRMQELSGHKICMVDIAPEREGAMEFIRELARDVVISVAHTNADYDTARKAMEAGAHHVTHLYNAMSAFQHRAPGVIGAAIDDPECMAELITDGVHHHPTADRAAFTLLGGDRIVLISDSMRATGMPDGEYELGGHQVRVKGKRALLPDGTIAASVTNLYDCMVTCIREIGIPIETAVKAATLNAARSIRMDRDYGSIAVGKSADALIVEPGTLKLQHVILRGQLLY